MILTTLLQIVLGFFMGWNVLVWETQSRRAAPPAGFVGKPAPDFTMIFEPNEESRLSDFRGKWILLLFGGTSSPRAEVMGLTASNIRQSLEGLPFEFIQIYNDASPLDARLMKFCQMAGRIAVRGGGATDPRFTRSRPATWFLIDPGGLVRTGGNFYSLPDIRRRLAAAWAGDRVMPRGPLKVSPVHALSETLAARLLATRYEDVYTTAEQLLAVDPENDFAMVSLIRASLHLHGYPETKKRMAERRKDRDVSDNVGRYLVECRLADSDDTTNRLAFLAILARNPESEVLQSLALPFFETPDAVSSADRLLLTTSWRSHYQSPIRGRNRAFLAFALQWSGQLREAASLMEKYPGQNGLDALGVIDTWHRLGWNSQIDALLSLEPDVTSENADSKTAWQQMHKNFVVNDFPTALAYATRYQVVRPERAQGALLADLIGVIQDPTRAPLSERSLLLLRQGERYSAAHPWLESRDPPSTTDLTDIRDLHVRFDTVLALALRFWNSPAQRDLLLTRAQTAFCPMDWPYAIVNNLRWRTRHPKRAAGTARLGTGWETEQEMAVPPVVGNLRWENDR